MYRSLSTADILLHKCAPGQARPLFRLAVYDDIKRHNTHNTGIWIHNINPIYKIGVCPFKITVFWVTFYSLDQNNETSLVFNKTMISWTLNKKFRFWMVGPLEFQMTTCLVFRCLVFKCQLCFERINYNFKKWHWTIQILITGLAGYLVNTVQWGSE